MKDKVVIITGASSGIGKACAEEFGKKGARVVITGRSKMSLLETADYLRTSGIDTLPIVADASSKEDNKRMVEETIKHYGKIDILINNAGISMRALFAELDLQVFEKVMDINFYGAV